MKKTTIFLILIAITVFLFNACEKETFQEENLVLKAKPTTPPGQDKDDPPTEDPSGYPLADAAEAQQIDVYGVWHAGNDYCTWGTVRDMAEFDAANNWIINRGDGNPSVNLVVLSFVNPLTLMNATNPMDGIQPGMTQDVVDYFKNKGIRVMLSIGGFTYVDFWTEALTTNPVKLAQNAAAVAQTLGVGIEIDYEENTDPNIAGLETFINTYRSIIPYDATGTNHAARLTIDLAAGDRWLIALCQYASGNWLQTDNPVLDYANAMVPARQPSADAAIANWYEHIEGKPQYAPAIPSIAPCKFTGALYINDRKEIPECTDFANSLQNATSDFVTRVLPYGYGTENQVGETWGMLGYMFWAAETPSTRRVTADNCWDGVGAGAEAFNIPIPMPALRQN